MRCKNFNSIRVSHNALKLEQSGELNLLFSFLRSVVFALQSMYYLDYGDAEDTGLEKQSGRCVFDDAPLSIDAPMKTCAWLILQSHNKKAVLAVPLETISVAGYG